jgi:predicted XRE-type DNA-binding protein
MKGKACKTTYFGQIAVETGQNVSVNFQNRAKALGQAARRRRKALRLSQSEVARFAGCSRLLVSELERGKLTVRMDKLLDVLHVIGLEMRLQSGKEVLSIDENL